MVYAKSTFISCFLLVHLIRRWLCSPQNLNRSLPSAPLNATHPSAPPSSSSSSLSTTYGGKNASPRIVVAKHKASNPFHHSDSDDGLSDNNEDDDDEEDGWVGVSLNRKSTYSHERSKFSSSSPRTSSISQKRIRAGGTSSSRVSNSGFRITQVPDPPSLPSRLSTFLLTSPLLVPLIHYSTLCLRLYHDLPSGRITK